MIKIADDKKSKIENTTHVHKYYFNILENVFKWNIWTHHCRIFLKTLTHSFHIQYISTDYVDETQCRFIP